MEKTLKKISDIIETYEGGAWGSLESLQAMHRELVGCNYILTKYNIDYFQRYNSIQFNFKGSVAASKILAEEEVPELRITRKIMEAIDNVIWSMRSEISILKNESK